MRPPFFLTGSKFVPYSKKIYETIDHINLRTYTVMYPAFL